MTPFDAQDSSGNQAAILTPNLHAVWPRGPGRPPRSMPYFEALAGAGAGIGAGMAAGTPDGAEAVAAVPGTTVPGIAAAAPEAGALAAPAP